MSGHDPFRAKSATATIEAPAPPRARKLRVPEAAPAVVKWIRNGKTDADVKARASAAWEVETQRPKIRKTVADAVTAAL